MKTVVIMLKHVFIPLSAFAFLVLGLLACFCSALIEFFVLREILAIPGMKLNADTWAALLVLILEGSKLTLHFYGESLKKTSIEQDIPDFDVSSKRSLICFLKNGLVVFSLICSIICMVNAILSQMRLWFRTNPPRAEKHQNGVLWHRFPRISTSFAPLRRAM